MGYFNAVSYVSISIEQQLQSRAAWVHRTLWKDSGSANDNLWDTQEMDFGLDRPSTKATWEGDACC